MATKTTKVNPLNGMHTAGIYSDMTVDGPEIGTLVVIVDRAKNLPNRKSIGKQDPYCAARLGKEAKKTETDRRGGQTPKWDQELRFTVHDSPDYYQMKVSVFNDDKKTDLIGETWVHLQDVVVPGGGQNDLWHNLNYKGKYAGEIRIEITYYDSRPKQEKASDKMRQGVPNGVSDGARDAMAGPREPKPAAKRRPLPADPTGASPSPSGTPSQTQTPPRGYQAPPSPSGTPNQIQIPPRGYQAPSTYIHTQSPLQAVEYNATPQKSVHLQQGHRQSLASMSIYATPPGMTAVTPTSRSVQDDIYDAQDDYQTNHSGRQGRYEDHLEDQRVNSRFQYDPYDASSELPVSTEYDPLPTSDELPPPPPAHRSSHASPAGPTQSSNRRYEDPQFNAAREGSFEVPQQEGFRRSMPTYEQTPYQAYSPPHSQDEHISYPEDNNYRETAPRHHSHDERYSESYRSMQPTVEDDLSSTTNPYPLGHRDSESRLSLYDEGRFDHIPPTAPLNLSGRRSTTSDQYNGSVSPSQKFHVEPPSSVSPVSYRDLSQINSEVSSQTSYSQLSQQSHKSQNHMRQGDDQVSSSPGGYVPSLPPTLVAGMDPVIAQEVSERIYAEHRSSYNQPSAGSSRNRYSEQSNYRQSNSHPHRQQDTDPFVPAATSAPVPFVPAVATYDDRQSRIGSNIYTSIINPRAVSPDPRVPARKSVSPSPGPSPETRGFSGVPFGPDAYNALNPNVDAGALASSSPTTSKVGGHIHPGRLDDLEPPAKIILHDGREVDPSDHLPETSWAPEPELRGSKQSDSGRGRPTPGTQPMLSSGPRPLRQTARPYSTASSPIHPAGGFSEPPAPAGRNRLQKKANRNYGAPVVHSSPLAPVSSYQDNSFATKGLARAQTRDFAGENGYGSYGSGTGRSRGVYSRNSLSGPPPVPAKVPISHGPPPALPSEDSWALVEEMKSIDLGGGRSRRKGYENRAFI